MPNWDEIKNEWETTKVTFKDLAEKYEVKDSTIRSRKNREKWQRNDATQRKNVATQKRSKSPPEKDVKEPIVESDELTEKQRLFCLYYVKTFNATQSAIKAGYSPERAHVTGSELVRNRKVGEYIRELKGNLTNSLFLDAMDVLRKYAAIAFADITDFVEFGQKEQPEFDILKGEPVLDDNGEQVMYKYSFVNLRNADDVDGTIITEVKKGKDGVSIKLADKMKALEFLSKYMDLLSENDRKKLQEEKIKADIAKVRSETKGTGKANINVVDFSNLSTEELRAIANSNKRTD